MRRRAGTVALVWRDHGAAGAGRGADCDLGGAARRSHCAAHFGHQGRSALRQDGCRLGRGCFAANVFSGAETGAGFHSARAGDGARGMESAAGLARAGWTRCAGAGHRYRRRRRCRCAVAPLSCRSGQFGKVCDAGLWGWSRHPNYFFEWFGWLAYPLLAIDFSGVYPWGFAALLGPACMYWLLVYVSGIPPLEAHMLERRRDEFRAYQARTSAFFPVPPRAGA
jgi:hypothetical protein